MQLVLRIWCLAFVLMTALAGRATADAPVVFHTDHTLIEEHSLRAELSQLHASLQAELGVPALSQTAKVFVLRDAAAYRAFLRKVPGVRPTYRVGLFLKRGGVPHIFTYRHAELRETLRHEFTHCVLNDAHPGLPIWLDEGLAEFYERPQQDGEQPRYRKLLKRQSTWFWKPKPARLASWKRMSDMQLREYAEAWSWVYLLRRRVVNGNDVLRDYLGALRNGKQPGDLADYLPRIIHEATSAWEHEFRG